jgi:flagellar motor switch protein FliM
MAEATETQKPAGELSEEERMAAEWAALAEDESPDGADQAADAKLDAAPVGASTRVLDQTEIDSLLGVQGGSSDAEGSKGLAAILDSGHVSYERLPMLEVVYDRLVRLMSTSLRNFTSDNVEVSIDNIFSVRFGEYLNTIPLPAMLGVFEATQWQNYGLIFVESSLIYSTVDVLLGGRRGAASMRIEGRPYTTIERNLIQRMIGVVLADLTAAFEPLYPISFRFDRLETNPRFATIARPGNAAIVAKLRVEMEDRGGRLELVFPYSTLEPIRNLLLQMFLGEKFGHDPIWEGHLATELWYTNIDIEAVLDQQMMKLNDLINLEVGSRILFNAQPNSEVELRCGGQRMFVGHMGRRRSSIAVCIDRKIEKRSGDAG